MPKEKKIRLSLYGVDNGLWSFLKALEVQALEQGWSQNKVTNLIDNAFKKVDFISITHSILDHCTITKMQKGIKVKNGEIINRP